MRSTSPRLARSHFHSYSHCCRWGTIRRWQWAQEWMRRSRGKKTRERRTSRDGVPGPGIRSLGAQGARARTLPGCDLRRAARQAARPRRSGYAGARAYGQGSQWTRYAEGGRERRRAHPELISERIRSFAGSSYRMSSPSSTVKPSRQNVMCRMAVSSGSARVNEHELDHER